MPFSINKNTGNWLSKEENARLLKAIHSPVGLEEHIMIDNTVK